MQTLPLYQVDAFASQPFQGNPAAVVPLPEWPEDSLLQAIAAEQNLSETAFIVDGDGDWELRWFTPATEVDLCGHATLAAAHVLFEHLGARGDALCFSTRSGPLRVRREQAGLVMDFPAVASTPCQPPPALVAGLGLTPAHTLAGTDYLAVLADAAAVAALQPDLGQLARLNRRGIIVTASGSDHGDGRYDFVSRFFGPAVGVPEDPVTGSAHCQLAPYWAGRLGRERLLARQLSARGGDVHCTLLGDRVALRGQAVTWLVGHIHLP